MKRASSQETIEPEIDIFDINHRHHRKSRNRSMKQQSRGAEVENSQDLSKQNDSVLSPVMSEGLEPINPVFDLKYSKKHIK